MPTLYVAGPVFDPWDQPEVYGDIAATAERYGWEAELPLRRGEIGDMPSQEFVRATTDRIRRADAVVCVLRPGDQSVPAEAAIASFSGKPQVVVRDGGKRVRRMIEGLPGVAEVVDAGSEVPGAVERLVARPSF
jgi:nucleoside 2-deoxyribosyltransferase